MIPADPRDRDYTAPAPRFTVLESASVEAASADEPPSYFILDAAIDDVIDGWHDTREEAEQRARRLNAVVT